MSSIEHPEHRGGGGGVGGGGGKTQKKTDVHESRVRLGVHGSIVFGVFVGVIPYHVDVTDPA